MKRLFLVSVFALMIVALSAQQKSQALPPRTYITLHDSTTSIDVVFLQGKVGSLSIDGRNVKLFNSFFENTTAQKTNVAQAGNIMWQINGKEFLSGGFFLGDSTGYVVIKKDGKEYVNQISGQGNSFFKNQTKK